MDAPVFALGHQFREADGIVVAAPFWDLSVPAVLKVYIENISADGVTFCKQAEGLYGLCRAEWMLFLTTRGGLFTKARIWSRAAGIWRLFPDSLALTPISVYGEGLDVAELDGESILAAALAETEHVPRPLKKA